MAIFIPIGGAIISASASVVETPVVYHDRPLDEATCDKYQTGNTNCTCEDVFKRYSDYVNPPKFECVHTITFTVPNAIPKPVYMYYRLENFHQNHRRFAKSRYDPQLAGKSVSKSDVEENCAPFDVAGDKIINPCGLIAWAKFNDSFVLSELTPGNPTHICDTEVPSEWQCKQSPFAQTAYKEACKNRIQPCTKDGIAWASDRDAKFHQPPSYQENPDYLSFDGNNSYPDEPGHLIPDVNDEDLMVWMRTAAMPSFRKLLRKINIELKTGVTYELKITQRYPVYSFGGTKALIFANNAWIGGRSELLGAAYLVIGAMCALLAVAFLLKHMFKPRDPGNLAFFQNHRDGH